MTPDSFSDGGDYLRPSAAIDHARQLVAAGADLIDIGGESSRPGAEPVTAADEIDRVLPVVAGLADLGVPISIDTSKAEVAEAALSAGAAIVNDITALGDPDMGSLVAARGAGLVLMHMQGEPRTMQLDPSYDDVVEEVAVELDAAMQRAVAAGVEPARICLDPGIGFGKDLTHNLDLLALGIARLSRLGRPVMVGASRKSFITKVVGDVSVRHREAATVSAHVLAVAGGASVIRTHNVAMALQSVRLADAIVRGA